MKFNFYQNLMKKILVWIYLAFVLIQYLDFSGPIILYWEELMINWIEPTTQISAYLSPILKNLLPKNKHGPRISMADQWYLSQSPQKSMIFLGYSEIYV